MPGKVFIQILGTGSKDYSSSIFIFTENRRYLFNAGEGVCRYALERGVKLVKITDVFFSECTWELMGGFFDALFNIDGAVDLDVLGPANLIDSILCTRFFMHLPKKCLYMEEYYGKREEQRRRVNGPDDLLITPVMIVPTGQPEITRRPSKRFQLNLAYDTWTTRQQPPPSQARLCFIVELPTIAGKFDAKKAKALGVEPGPKCGQLTRGEPVHLSDGRVVKPEDVIGPPTKGGMAMLLFCPSIEYVDSMISAGEIDSILSVAEQSKRVHFVLHTTPASVFESAKYRAFLTRFAPNTKHVVLNENSPSRVACLAPAMHHSAFRLTAPAYFPELFFHTHPPKDLAPHVFAAELLMRIELQPKVCIDRSDIVEKLDTEAQTVLLESSAEWNAQVEDLKLLSHGIQNDQPVSSSVDTSSSTTHVAFERLRDLKDGEVSVYFLGTSAASPVMYRNVSGIFVEFPSGSLLLDCGEGSLGQLYRLFGEQLDEKILRLQMVFLTHHHADHFCGVTRVLSYRDKLHKKLSLPSSTSLLVIGDPPIQNWLREYSKSSESLNYQFCLIDSLQNATNGLTDWATKMHFSQFQSVPVRHCWYAHGLVLNYRNAFKLVYSGDTMECPELISIGKDCTLLIHEATFENGWEAMATKKRHSTTQQALKTARSMNAARTILTHFSSRYSYEWPAFDASEHRDVFVAFDLLKVPITRTHLKLMPKILSSLHTALTLIAKFSTKPMEIESTTTTTDTASSASANSKKRTSSKGAGKIESAKSNSSASAAVTPSVLRATASDSEEEDDENNK